MNNLRSYFSYTQVFIAVQSFHSSKLHLTFLDSAQQQTQLCLTLNPCWYAIYTKEISNSSFRQWWDHDRAHVYCLKQNGWSKQAWIWSRCHGYSTSLKQCNQNVKSGGLYILYSLLVVMNRHSSLELCNLWVMEHKLLCDPILIGTCIVYSQNQIIIVIWLRPLVHEMRRMKISWLARQSCPLIEEWTKSARIANNMGQGHCYGYSSAIKVV